MVDGFGQIADDGLWWQIGEGGGLVADRQIFCENLSLCVPIRMYVYNVYLRHPAE